MRRRRARYGTRGLRAPPPRSSPRRAARASFPERDEIREQSIGTGDGFGELAKPGEARVDEVSLALPSHQEAALERSLAGIPGREDRGETLIPLIGEVETALLHPALEVCRGDAVRRGQHRMLRRQDPNRRVLVGHTVA